MMPGMGAGNTHGYFGAVSLFVPLTLHLTWLYNFESF